MSEFIEIDAPAKINLFLVLTGKRGDGFNQLISIISKLELKDTLKVRKSGSPGSLALTCHKYPELETTQNLVAHAIDAFPPFNAFAHRIWRDDHAYYLLVH